MGFKQLTCLLMDFRHRISLGSTEYPNRGSGINTRICLIITRWCHCTWKSFHTSMRLHHLASELLPSMPDPFTVALTRSQPDQVALQVSLLMATWLLLCHMRSAKEVFHTLNWVCRSKRRSFWLLMDLLTHEISIPNQPNWRCYVRTQPLQHRHSRRSCTPSRTSFLAVGRLQSTLPELLSLKTKLLVKSQRSLWTWLQTKWCCFTNRLLKKVGPQLPSPREIETALPPMWQGDLPFLNGVW